jgi:fibro-slime domain-containing protein
VKGTPTTHGAAAFFDWYHDVPGENLSTTIPLVFQPDASHAGDYRFDDEMFFPIDGQLFGNQGAPNNENITAEVHAKVVYSGGETWGFASDDDLWVFVNGHLVIDLGGLHASMSQSVMLDQVAAAAGIVAGQTYPFDLFYANREPTGAVLLISIPSSDIWGCP